MYGFQLGSQILSVESPYPGLIKAEPIKKGSFSISFTAYEGHSCIFTSLYTSLSTFFHLP